MELGLLEVSEGVLLHDIWVPVEIALSLLIGHVRGGNHSSLFGGQFDTLLGCHHDEVRVAQLLVDAVEHLHILSLRLVKAISGLNELLLVLILSLRVLTDFDVGSD